ncbi:MAG: iron ABC transporter permease [Planctomycetia bacterium]|nr:iron ABC transporter permease [Planctomycetia bacterium]
MKKSVIGSILLLLAVLVFLPLWGRTVLSPSVFRDWPFFGRELSDLSPSAQIYWGERFPRTLLSMIAGSGLALAGLVLQAVFRNPLATPYTLGIASGASFGAVLVLHLSSFFSINALIFGISPVPFGAFCGSLLSMGIVYGLAGQRARKGDQMLLAGVAVSFFFSSLILCCQYISDPSRTFQMIRWTMGGIEQCGYGSLAFLFFLVFGMGIVLFFLARDLNLLLLGEEKAAALGMDVHRFHLKMFFLTSLLVGAIVSVCGPIGFVGLMVPHLCRRMVGSDHRRLVPWTFTAGAVFLAVCFTLSRTILFPGILPVGLITSLLGGPFFLWILLKRK